MVMLKNARTCAACLKEHPKSEFKENPCEKEGIKCLWKEGQTRKSPCPLCPDCIDKEFKGRKDFLDAQKFLAPTTMADLIKVVRESTEEEREPLRKIIEAHRLRLQDQDDHASESEEEEDEHLSESEEEVEDEAQEEEEHFCAKCDCGIPHKNIPKITAHYWNPDKKSWEVKRNKEILCQDCEKEVQEQAESQEEFYGWAIATPSVMALMESGVPEGQAKAVMMDVRPQAPNTSKKQKKEKVAGTKKDGRKTRETQEHNHSMKKGDIVEHTYKGFTAKAEYCGNDQVRYGGRAPAGLSGFCKAHVESLLEDEKIVKGSTSWNGWAVCNLPGKKKGVWN